MSECARAMLLHASMHWKDGISSALWPMAVNYATYIYNNLLQANGVCPADLFMGTTIPRHKLKDIHTWGCPVYVLDPKLQQGKKLPRWDPKACRGIFLGFSPHHSSDVPLVLNLVTGHISPQYHVVFDDNFDTVILHSSADDPPSFWAEIGIDDAVHAAHVHRIPLDTDSPISLSEEWLSPAELEEKRRQLDHSSQIHVRFAPTVKIQPGQSNSFPPQSPTSGSSSVVPGNNSSTLSSPTPSAPLDSTPSSQPVPSPATDATLTPQPFSLMAPRRSA